MERRSANLIINGVSEDNPLVNGAGTAAESDTDKVSMILAEIGCSSIIVPKFERLGQKLEAKQRPIKLTFNGPDDKVAVLTSAKKLKQLKKMYVNKDMTP
jgi:hypothetical protein